MRAFKVACGLASAVPWLLVAVLVWVNRVNAPQGAEWLLVPALEKSYLGTLTPLDLWRQHNEHRFFFPTAIIVLLAHLTRWDVTPILLLNLFLAGGIFILLARQASATLRSAGMRRTAWIFPILSVILFSLHQWENWMGQLELSTFLQIFATLAAIAALTAPTLRWPNLAWAAVLGWIGTYSRGNGLLIWPIGWFLLAARTDGRAIPRRASLRLWTMIAAVVTLSYLYRYHKISHHPSVWLFAQQPFEYLRYVCALLGSPVIHFNLLGACWAGAAGLLLFAGIGAKLLRSGAISWDRFLPHMGLGLYAIGSALLIGLGRTGFGSTQAMTCRYVTHANLLWVALLTLLALKIALTPPASSFARRLWTATIPAIVLLNVFSSLNAVHSFRRQHDRLIVFREIMSASDGRLLPLFCPSPPEILKTQIAFLRSRHLCAFRGDK